MSFSVKIEKLVKSSRFVVLKNVKTVGVGETKDDRQMIMRQDADKR